MVQTLSYYQRCMNISSIHTIYPEVVIRGCNYMDGHSIVFIRYGEIVVVIVRIKLHKIIDHIILPKNVYYWDGCAYRDSTSTPL
jgi:hypothetical protein